MNSIVEYFLTWTDDPLGQVHLGFALVALSMGPLILLRRKGDWLHRVSGLTYTGSMIALNGSALLNYDLTGSANMFHVFALFSLATIIPAWTSIRKGRLTGEARYFFRHATLMIWSYYGLVMAAVAEIITRRFPFMLHGDGGWMRFSVMLTVIMVIAGLLTLALIRRYIPPFMQRFKTG